jgi:hypothetical protein
MKEDMLVKFWLEYRSARHHLGYLGADVRTIIKYMPEKRV